MKNIKFLLISACLCISACEKSDADSDSKNQKTLTEDAKHHSVQASQKIPEDDSDNASANDRLTPAQLLEGWRNAGHGTKRNQNFARKISQLPAQEFADLCEELLKDFEPSDTESKADFLQHLTVWIRKNDPGWTFAALNAVQSPDLGHILLENIESKRSNFQPQEGISAAKSVISHNQSNKSRQVASSLLLAAAEKTPLQAADAALDLSRSIPSKPGSVSPLTSVVTAWESKDSGGAREWIEKHLTGDEYKSAISAIVSKWLREDSVKASSDVDKLPPGSFKDNAAYRLSFYCIESGDTETAVLWAECIQSDKLKEMIRVHLNNR